MGFLRTSDPDANLVRIQGQFIKIHERLDRPARLRRGLQRAIWPIVCVGMVLAPVFGVALAKDWSLLISARHLVSGVNCDSARAVDLAPAPRGRPGYWPGNDADNDGVACEEYLGIRHRDRVYFGR